MFLDKEYSETLCCSVYRLYVRFYEVLYSLWVYELFVKVLWIFYEYSLNDLFIQSLRFRGLFFNIKMSYQITEVIGVTVFIFTSDLFLN